MTDSGFTWGPMTVERVTEIYGMKVLLIRAGSTDLQISVSPTGRSVRVWKNSKEMKA